ncbi:uncharacterized protein [Coffea arabica]|uniref:Uncharacterized protein LOC113716629 n=1 Tax=Coffea arabica TaxID=13443 RepID=A0A6P6V2B2_COFAR|nr:uncharacterized protein LOC113716629 [Coffea arabica]
MGLFTYTIAGGGFILIGAWESFVSSSECIQNTPLSPPLTSPRAISAINNSSTQTKKAPLSSSSVTCISISVLSFFFILNSLIFISDALNSKDHVGFAFQLEGKSRGNYTIKCKGHPEYHRGRAIAMLQFNCHLALLVTLSVVVYGIVRKKHGIRRDLLQYRPLGAEIQHLDGQPQFTLDSDDDLDDADQNGIKEVRSVEMQKAIVAVPASEVNGYGTH